MSIYICLKKLKHLIFINGGTSGLGVPSGRLPSRLPRPTASTRRLAAGYAYAAVSESHLWVSTGIIGNAHGLLEEVTPPAARRANNNEYCDKARMIKGLYRSRTRSGC
jgi:hypothetical protein